MKIFTFSKDSVKKLLIAFVISIILFVIGIPLLMIILGTLYKWSGVGILVSILIFIPPILLFLLFLQLFSWIILEITKKSNFKNKKIIQIILTIIISLVVVFLVINGILSWLESIFEPLPW